MDRRMDRRTDGGDCNIPDAFYRSVGIIMKCLISQRVIIKSLITNLVLYAIITDDPYSN